MSTLPAGTGPSDRLGVIRCGLTGAASLAIFFAVCWVATLPFADQSHMFIQIFTTQPVASVAALGEGLFWSVTFGAFAGVLLALVYNAMSFLGRR